MLQTIGDQLIVSRSITLLYLGLDCNLLVLKNQLIGDQKRIS